MSKVNVLRDVNGNIPISEMFRPVLSNNVITDSNGKQWKQITALGWYRLEDKFFWPADPTNTNNLIGNLPPTVEEIKKNRET